MNNPNQKDVEVWKEIPSFPGYEASNLGRVRSVTRTDRLGRCRQGRVLSNARDGGRGYIQVRLRQNNRNKSLSMHRLILEAFVGTRESRQQCRHLDGNKKNNRLDNLCWGTSAQNNADKITHGTIAKYDRNGSAKLTPALVSQCKRMATYGVPASVLAQYLGVNRNIPTAIIKGEAWQGIRTGKPSPDEQALYRNISFWAAAKKRHLHRASLVEGVADVRVAEIAEQEIRALLAVAVTFADTMARPAPSVAGGAAEGRGQQP